jgi:diguanylate cyclase (GGDEF)-like protein
MLNERDGRDPPERSAMYPKRNPDDSEGPRPARASVGEREERSSERDVAATERDQAADQRDRAADALDEAAGESERASQRRLVRASERGPEDRARAASERADAARDRGAATTERQAVARRLERAGQESDEAAERRDRAAEALDEAAGEIERASALHSVRDSQRAPDARARAASGRAEAASDRQVAARDREHAADDREASATDELTGARRRGAGLAELRREIDRARRRSEPLVAAFVDVDGLKEVNDTQGHRAGDELLAAVGDALGRSLRSYDLVIRVGGDEFVCVLSDITVEDARQRLAAVCERVGAGRAGGSISVGFAELQPDDSPHDLIARADAALLDARGRPSAR